MAHEALQKALNARRLARGWGYERLAADIGMDYVSGQTLRRFIAGAHAPSERTLYAVTRYLAKAKAKAA